MVTIGFLAVMALEVLAMAGALASGLGLIGCELTKSVVYVSFNILSFF